MEDRHSGFRYTTFKRRWISYPERLGTAASIGSEGPTAGGKGRDARRAGPGLEPELANGATRSGRSRKEKNDSQAKPGDAFYSFNST